MPIITTDNDGLFSGQRRLPLIHCADVIVAANEAAFSSMAWANMLKKFYLCVNAQTKLGYCVKCNSMQIAVRQWLIIFL